MVCELMFLVKFLIILIVLVHIDQSSSENPVKSTDYLLCRFCGYNISPASTLANIRSPAALASYNQTLFGLKGVEVQSIKNLLGIQFEIVTSRGSTCIPSSKKWEIENSWYPGHAWKSCACSKCQRHIGWIFEPLQTATDIRLYASDNGFYAFVLYNIISENSDVVEDFFMKELKKEVDISTFNNYLLLRHVSIKY